jgi:ABC-type antimicrobial peptide transport system permease subunit
MRRQDGTFNLLFRKDNVIPTFTLVNRNPLRRIGRARRDREPDLRRKDRDGLGRDGLGELFSGDMRTVHEQVGVSLVTERLMATLSTVFGSLATLLAAMGLYGVMAYMVARRTQEIGIRMALGAGRGSVLWLVMREVLLLAAIGLAIGLLSAWGLTRLVEAQLFGIKPFDLRTMLLATAGIASVAMLAGYLPARRASGIDPMRALRFE